MHASLDHHIYASKDLVALMHVIKTICMYVAARVPITNKAAIFILCKPIIFLVHSLSVFSVAMMRMMMTELFLNGVR